MITKHIDAITSPKMNGYKIFLAIMILLSLWPLLVPTSDATDSNAFTAFLVSTEAIFFIVFAYDFFLRCKAFKSVYYGTFFFWIELIALASFILPALIPALSWMVGLRVLKALRLLSYSKTFMILGYIFKVEKNFMSSIGMAILSIVFVGAALIFQSEHAVQPENFQTFGDALFYSAITLTTVGYGNLVAQTPWGQFVSFLISVCGIILIALPTTMITARIISIRQKYPDLTFEEFYTREVKKLKEKESKENE